MVEEFGGESSLKMLQMLSQYKKLTARQNEGLSPEEMKTLKELEKKIGRLIEPKVQPQVQEQRQALRIKTNLEVRMRHLGDFSKYYIKNISGGGMFIGTDQQHAIGAALEFDLQLPDDSEVLKLKGEVTWVSPKPIGDLPAGVGVKFVDMSDKDRRKIDRVLEQALTDALTKPRKPTKPEKK